MQPLRDYQLQAIAGVHSAWNEGHRCVLLVCPTGGGKTRQAEELVYRERMAGGWVLFVVHRLELLHQTAERLRSRFGHLEVGLIAPGAEFSPDAPIQVATVQTLLAREHRPRATLLVLDEAHHYVADEWRAVDEQYRSARVLGLTATPQRSDGKPLGDMFTGLVVAAQYSDLVRDGFLTQCRVYQPSEEVQGGLAQDPVLAYQRYAEGSRAFVFCGNVAAAHELAGRFTAEGIAAAAIEAKTPKAERAEVIERFAAGELRVVTNVFALTEGVDVPAARTCILARGCAHVGPFLQMVGRVLRPHASKPDAILIDLSGATLRHGMPTEDRVYALDGEGIKRTSAVPLRNCLRCAATLPAWQRQCPECGYQAERQVSEVRIYDMELRAVYAGAETPATAKQREFERLRALVRDKGWSLGWAAQQYRKLFAGEAPPFSEPEWRSVFLELARHGQSRGFKPGYALARFKELSGRWPPRGWRAAV